MGVMQNTTCTANRRALFNLWQDLREQYLAGIPGWRLVIDRRPRNRLGQCRYRSKEIGISKWILYACDWETIEDTLRHEIAHVLAPGDGHGPRWKRMAREVGADPERLCRLKAHEKALKPKTALERRGFKYLASCPFCGSLPGGRMRMTAAMRRGAFVHRRCGEKIRWERVW